MLPRQLGDDESPGGVCAQGSLLPKCEPARVCIGRRCASMPKHVAGRIGSQLDIQVGLDTAARASDIFAVV